MLPARYRLTSRSEISETIRRGHRARSGGVVVHLQTDVHSQSAEAAGVSPSSSRAAFAVSKAVGNSVVRHQVVRRLRVVVLPMLDTLPAGSRVVIRALPEAATESTVRLARDVDRAMTRLVGSRTLAESPPDSHPPGVSPPGVNLQGVNPPAPDGTPPVTRTGLSRFMWVIGSPLRWLLLSLIWAYRHTISPILPPTCRYHPSCSAYALGALQAHGAAKGTLLAGWRLLRCNPFSLGGLDPVPERGQWRAPIDPDGTPRAPQGSTA